jgi:hypothetical protein
MRKVWGWGREALGEKKERERGERVTDGTRVWVVGMKEKYEGRWMQGR